MGLAAILGVYLLSAGWSPPAIGGPVPQTAAQSPAATSSDSSTHQSQGTSASEPQSAPSQSAEPAQPLSSPNPQTPNPAAQAKPSPPRPRHHKKTPSNCSSAPTALNTAVAKPADSANPVGSGSSDAGSANTGSTNAAPIVGSTIPGATPSRPCPPPKKVVRDGGSSEPKVQLTGGTTAQQASDKSSTEQLRAATEENLKKAEARELSPSQREMVNQIKQFMEQSKAAVAAGDLERGHNLALKANLLSDELVKP
jgi:hypothetical protein